MQQPTNMKNNNFVAMTTCFFCGEGKDILIHKRLGDLSHVDKKCVDKEPCPKCEEHMKNGVIFISVRDGEEGQNPYRTGGFWVIKDAAVRRCINNAELAEEVIWKRCCFIPESVCKQMGLVIPEAKETS